MSRLVNILLMLLVIIAFFFGVNIGKTIQKIDTPVQIQYKTKKVVSNPSITLSRHLLSTCGFSFITTNSILVKASSQSAVLTQGSQSLDLLCGKTQKTITASGSSVLLDSVKQGFDTNFSIQSSNY